MNISSIPLRYPGGKHKFIDYVGLFLKAHSPNCELLVEPFAGSAAVSFGLLERAFVKEVLLIEHDPIIAAFWNVALSRTEELAELVLKAKIDLKQFDEHRAYAHSFEYTADSASHLRAAFAFLFLNRTSYSGIIGSGPLGGRSQSSEYTIDCRFNRQRIAYQLRHLSTYRERVRIVFGDGIELLGMLSNTWDRSTTAVYADPPYVDQGPKLYRRSFQAEQHKHLAQVLEGMNQPWLLSYDDSEFVKKLYHGKETCKVFFDYSVRTSKRATEIVISNRVLPPLHASSVDRDATPFTASA